MSFREKDYLKKQVEGLARVLAAILGLKDAGRVDEARAELEAAAKSTLGIGTGLLNRIDPASAVGLLRSREKALAYADVLEAQAAVEENDALRERARAVREIADS